MNCWLLPVLIVGVTDSDLIFIDLAVLECSCLDIGVLWWQLWCIDCA